MIKKWEEALKGKKFVWLLSPPWDGVWTRQNHFSRRLASLGAEVLYVEAPFGWKSHFKEKKIPSLIKKTIREVEPRLHVMTLPAHIPGANHYELIADLNGKNNAKQIKDWLKEKDWRNYVCWCRLPFSILTLNHLNPSAIVYDITDDYELYTRGNTEKKLCQNREKQLAKISDLIFIASEELRKKNLPGPPKIFLPNGVDFDLFSQVSTTNFSTHPKLREIQKPVIGYIGLISRWMDFKLLRMLGQKWPGHVVLVGPIHAEIQKLVSELPGVVCLGFVPHIKVPRFISGFDICILPHKVSELRHRANPLKIWEYMATGKPFVSVSLRALNPLKEIVDVAENREHFIELVTKRLEGESPERAEARKEFARHYSWDVLFNKLMESLHSKLH